MLNQIQVERQVGLQSQIWIDITKQKFVSCAAQIRIDSIQSHRSGRPRQPRSMTNIKISMTQRLEAQLPSLFTEPAKFSNSTSPLQLSNSVHGIIAIDHNLHFNNNKSSFLTSINASYANSNCSHNYCVHVSNQSNDTTTQTSQHLASCTVLESCKSTSLQHSITETLDRVSGKIYV